VARSRPGTSIDSLVIGLVDRFLLAFGADELRIHPLILEYCRSLLPDRAAAHRRAAQFFLADADGSASTSDTLSDSQVEKMVSAWSHLIAAEDNVPAAALVEKLRRPLFNSARYGQLMRLLQETKPTTPRQTIRFALDKARVLAVWGDVDEAMKLVGSAQQSADPISLREVVLVSVFVHLSARMAEKALRILEEKHYMFSGEDVPVRTRMRFLSRCVEAHLQLGNGVRAYEWAAQIREICERENDTIGGAGALRQMATSLRAQKRLDLALTLATLSQDLFRENGHDGDAAISEVLVASLFVDTGKTSEALPLFENALQKLLLTGNREHIADCREHIQKLALLGTP
jgi:tetratricopeptide (TPR) repeat protein